MALYLARWTNPQSLKPMVRPFHSRQKAEAFRDLPRVDAVAIAIQRQSEIRP